MTATFREAHYNPVGTHTQNTSLNTVQTLTFPNLEWRKLAVLVQVFDQDVNLTLDGTAPTASLGFTLTAGDPAVLIPIGEDTVLKFIEVAASARLEYQFVRID